MDQGFMITKDFLADQNAKDLPDLQTDFDFLATRLQRQNLNIDTIMNDTQEFNIAVPSWGVGTGGTRFARFPGLGEPRNIFEKLVDCGTIHQLLTFTPNISLHIPWDKVDDTQGLKSFAAELGLGFDAMNSNTFQDQEGQAHSYKFGSLTHTDPAVRKQAIDHNIECIEIGKDLGSKALTVWIADGSNFPGQQHFRHSLERYLDSMRQIYTALPADWRIYIEHKLFEPAFYSTVINDWGTNYYCVNELGDKAFSLVDLGHHAPNTNIEMVVARLIQFGKLGGFHLNDSKYGDDDLDAGSLKPYQLFLIFNELLDAKQNNVPNFDPCYMLDQSHNVTDPIESLMLSAVEAQRAYVQALLVDRQALDQAQEDNDAIAARTILKSAYHTDVAPILAMLRYRDGGAINPLAVYRASSYRQQKDEERPQVHGSGSGIV